MPHMVVKEHFFPKQKPRYVVLLIKPIVWSVSPHSYKKFKLLVCPPPAPSAFFLPCILCLAIWPWFVSRYPLGLLFSWLILNTEHLHPTPPPTHQFTMSRTIPPHLLGLNVKILFQEARSYFLILG